MANPFRWIKLRVMIYSTEDRERVTEMFMDLSGTDELEVGIAEGEFGNETLIMEATLTKKRDFSQLFSKLEQDTVESVFSELEERIDDDCTFYFRLDKQRAMSGSYLIGSGGDVVSVTCKVASYPAKRELAIGVMREFFSSLLPSPQTPQ
ncbi:MAG TPA: RNA-binding domain-containing protein [Candidatus Methanomethylophilaceae archaeon]|nr:RNA-binding domain-containing protein [Candidatus Methanomethylophilaceae archaeon]